MEEHKKELNLAEILTNFPKGTKLYSVLFGEVVLEGVLEEKDNRIAIRTARNTTEYILKNGKFCYHELGECVLFPSKDNRDWSTFKVEKPRWNPDTLQPFDKVLVREGNISFWTGDLFLYIDNTSVHPYHGIATICKHCIPYNEDTKHLLGTDQEPPEFYNI